MKSRIINNILIFNKIILLNIFIILLFIAVLSNAQIKTTDWPVLKTYDQEPNPIHSLLVPVRQTKLQKKQKKVSWLNQ
jgi:hypothetical protein